jgi:RimJ/RimL family protein N-acetyltransferase
MGDWPSDLRYLNCLLSPLGNGDFECLYQICVLSDSARTWRYHGTRPPFEQFINELWRGVHTQFVVRASASGEVVGLVVAYDFDPIHLHCKLGVVVDPPGQGYGIQASLLFIDYLMSSFPLRKVYLEVPRTNLLRLQRALDQFAQLEGTLTEHFFAQGEWVDLLIYSVYRDEGGREIREILERTRGS